MVIDDFHIEGIAAVPAETNPPLVVDPNTELTRPCPLETLQPICRGLSQIVQGT